MPNAKTYKAITWDWEELTGIDDTPKLRFLSDRDVVSLLVASSTFMTWKTRWWNKPPSFDVVDAYTAELSDRLMTEIDFCQLMIDCIENTPEVFEAIQQQAAERGLPPPSPETAPGSGSTQSVLVTGCNLDAIYGQAVALEDYIAQVSRDLVELIVNSPGVLASVLRIIDYIPALGDLPVADDLNDLVTWLQVQGLTTFDAGYTTTLRQNNICAMFELACSDCELSMADITEIYRAGGAIAYNLNDPFRVLLEVVVGNVAPALFVYGVMAVVTAALTTGGEVAGLVGLSGLQTIAASGDPDGDWALFCNPCAGSFTQTWDFTVTDGGFSPEQGNQAVWASGVGWSADVGNQSVSHLIRIFRSFSSRTLTRIEFTINTQMSGNRDLAAINTEDNGTQTQVLLLQPTTLTTFDTGTISQNADRLNLTISEFFPPGVTSVTIISATVEGIGSNPF